MLKNNDHNKDLQGLWNLATTAEIKLWKVALRNRRTGYRCLRQRPVNRFIAGFFFPELKMILEVDDYSHSFKEKFRSDKKRDQILSGLGHKTLRIPAREVLENIDEVIQKIEFALENRRIELDLEKLERTKKNL